MPTASVWFPASTAPSVPLPEWHRINTESINVFRKTAEYAHYSAEYALKKASRLLDFLYRDCKFRIRIPNANNFFEEKNCDPVWSGSEAVAVSSFRAGNDDHSRE